MFNDLESVSRTINYAGDHSRFKQNDAGGHKIKFNMSEKHQIIVDNKHINTNSERMMSTKLYLREAVKVSTKKVFK